MADRKTVSITLTEDSMSLLDGLCSRHNTTRGRMVENLIVAQIAREQIEQGQQTIPACE